MFTSRLCRSFFISLSILFFVLPVGAEDLRFIVETGPGEASAFSLSNETSLFTGGQDGSLRVWDLDSGKQLFSTKISRFPLKMATLHPKKPEIAVVTSDSLGSYVLAIWDWEKGEKKGVFKLPEVPLFLKYAPTGDYLLYGITKWKSLTFLDTEKIAVLPYLTDGFGIVSNAFISGSGNTVLTYSPSGTIQYWGVQDSRLKKKVTTLPNLTNIDFGANGRYMAATDGTSLLVIDLLTGSPREKVALPAIDHLCFSPSRSTLAAYNENNSGFRLNLYQFNNGNLNLAMSYPNLGLRKIDTFLPLDDKLLATLPDGNIRKFSYRTERVTSFSDNTLRKITDLDATDKVLLLGTTTELLSLKTDIFSDPRGLDMNSFKVTKEVLPFSGTPGITAFDDSSFIIYTKEGQSGAMALFSPREGTLNYHDGYPYAFSQIDVLDREIATLDRKGDISITDIDSGEIRFSFSSFGIQSIAFTNRETLIAGRGKSSSINTPLLHLNTVTEETVPVEDSNILTFGLNYDGLTKKLYSLGIEKRRNRLRTVLKSHSGDEFDKTETLSTIIGENLEAEMLIEEEGSRIFTSLGSQGINMLYWGGFTPFEEGLNAPGKIITMGNHLIALNQDGSLGFWNKATGKRAFTLFLFKDNSWLALFPEGKFLSSPGGEKYLSIFSETSANELNREQFRMDS